MCPWRVDLASLEPRVRKQQLEKLSPQIPGVSSQNSAFSSELASGTPLVVFSRSDSEGFVYSKIVFDIFFKKLVFLSQWNSLELAPGTPLVGFSRSDCEGFVYSKIDFDTFFQK